MSKDMLIDIIVNNRKPFIKDILINFKKYNKTQANY